jgi:hypothetical protein
MTPATSMGNQRSKCWHSLQGLGVCDAVMKLDMMLMLWQKPLDIRQLSNKTSNKAKSPLRFK